MQYCSMCVCTVNKNLTVGYPCSCGTMKFQIYDHTFLPSGSKSIMWTSQNGVYKIITTTTILLGHSVLICCFSHMQTRKHINLSDCTYRFINFMKFVPNHPDHTRICTLTVIASYIAFKPSMHDLLQANNITILTAPSSGLQGLL